MLHPTFRFRLILFILARFFQNAVTEAISAESFCEHYHDQAVPYETLAPINVDTKSAIPINGTTPLIIRNGVLGPVLLKNTGYALEIYGDPAVYTTGGTYGGVLCKQFYKFHKVRVHFSQNPEGGSYGQLDGVDPPLTLGILYYNTKYPSFDESLKHRDGVAYEIFHYTFQSESNPLFVPVDPVIRSLQEPGSEKYVNEAVAYSWFFKIPQIERYYAYLGSYEDLETGKHYESTLNIITDGIFPVLTKDQFQAFLSLKNTNGSKLQTVSALYPQGQREVYKADGVEGEFSPI